MPNGSSRLGQDMPADMEATRPLRVAIDPRHVRLGGGADPSSFQGAPYGVNGGGNAGNGPAPGFALDERTLEKAVTLDHNKEMRTSAASMTFGEMIELCGQVDASLSTLLPDDISQMSAPELRALISTKLPFAIHAWSKKLEQDASVEPPPASVQE